MGGRRMIENLIFDLGNVLIEWNPTKVLAAFVEDEGDRERVKAAVFDSGLWAQTDSGELTLQEASQAAAALLPEDLAARAEQIFYHWYEAVEVYQDLQAAIERWAGLGYRIYILSTTCEIFYHIERAGLLPMSQVLSGKVLSSEVKTVKPQPAIYQALLDQYSLDPAACLFIDDIEVNLTAAEDFGIWTILAQGEAANIAALRQMLQAKGKYGADI